MDAGRRAADAPAEDESETLNGEEAIEPFDVPRTSVSPIAAAIATDEPSATPLATVDDVCPMYPLVAVGASVGVGVGRGGVAVDTGVG